MPDQIEVARERTQKKDARQEQAKPASTHPVPPAEVLPTLAEGRRSDRLAHASKFPSNCPPMRRTDLHFMHHGDLSDARIGHACRRLAALLLRRQLVRGELPKIGPTS